MHIFFIMIIIIIGVIEVIQIYAMIKVKNTETQSYSIIRKEKKFEIRYYPTATMATFFSDLRNYNDLGNVGFGKLAKYIFGNNHGKTVMTMTSPVHMEMESLKSNMSFVLPKLYNQSNFPVPNEESIHIHSSKPEYAAAIQFSGFANTKRINNYITILRKSLKEIGYSYYGNFRYLGYNPPFQIFDRKNEVIVSLHESELNLENN